MPTLEDQGQVAHSMRALSIIQPLNHDNVGNLSYHIQTFPML